MKVIKLLNEIKGVFLPPEKSRYFGRPKYGTPYFEPPNYIGSIVRMRKLRLRPDNERELLNYTERSLRYIYSNYPMVRRSKNRIIKLFGNTYFITWGYPVSVKSTPLGWKDKYESPRFEWSPQFAIYFFGLQYIVWWNAPVINGERNNDKYYEMILWYLHYSDKDIKKARDTWGWVDMDTKESTWDEGYISH